MPDWSYRTVLRPALFLLPPAAARDLSLGVMGTLARTPMGPLVIDLMGHMRPDPRLRRPVMGIDFPAAVGLGAGLDVRATAFPALARFGFGFLEAGPVTLGPVSSGGPVERRPARQSIVAPDPPDNPGAEALDRRLAKLPKPGVPIFVRLAFARGTPPARAAAECRRMAELFAATADAFVLTPPVGEDGDATLRAVVEAARSAAPDRPLLLCVPPDLADDEVDEAADAARSLGLAGLLVDGGVRLDGGRREMGRPARDPALRTVRRLRDRLGVGPAIVASGGVHEPADALDLLAAGADLVQVDSGLVFGGPGLPKRINEAVLVGAEGEVIVPERPAGELSWFWAFLMGAGMLIGSVLALAIAATRVVLPYDELFVGLTRPQLAAANPRLLPFLTHDRVTLAGTMVATGVLYCGLAYFGIRRGLHWARVAVLSSAFAGFGTFFLFLGFGYFDAFHAFVTAILFQFLLLAIHARLSPPGRPPAPGLREEWRWRWSLWGQLLMIVQASAFVVAGLVISAVGVTSVFVPEDLEFLHTTRTALSAASPRLVPMIAHDRATLGGMLVASGLAFLLPSLWGYRRGAAWLWWSFLLASVPGYASAIGVHFAVGYHNAWHLFPAFVGVATCAAGLILSGPYLLDAGDRSGRIRRSGPGCPCG